MKRMMVGLLLVLSLATPAFSYSPTTEQKLERVREKIRDAERQTAQYRVSLPVLEERQRRIQKLKAEIERLKREIQAAKKR